MVFVCIVGSGNARSAVANWESGEDTQWAVGREDLTIILYSP